MLSWIGDACLLSRRKRPFLAGLVSFLLAHMAYGQIHSGLRHQVPRQLRGEQGVASATEDPGSLDRVE